MAILVTGGAGFIGSHTCVELLDHGHDIVVADDFSNSSPAAISAVSDLTGRDLAVHRVDLRDPAGLDRIFDSHAIGDVIHFAAKKAVGESMSIPFDYFDVNISGTINLLRTMAAHDVHRLVFSSSCSIYGDQYSRPITEDDAPGPVNPYARSKLICEQIMQQICDLFPDFSIISLRYFNPAGAHPSGRIGECPRGVPTNVVPYMTRIAAGQLERLQVFGTDYDTADGSAIRDYIHVVDVAEAHQLAVDHLGDQAGMRALNLGTGQGVSVLELVRLFEEACGIRIPHELSGRRAGDVASLVADAGRIEKEWGWRARRDIGSMLQDAWRFQQKIPASYGA